MFTYGQLVRVTSGKHQGCVGHVITRRLYNAEMLYYIELALIGVRIELSEYQLEDAVEDKDSSVLEWLDSI